MANITVDLTEKACRYVESLYNTRLEAVRTCERIMGVCGVDLKNPENSTLYSYAERVKESTDADLNAIDNALSALHLAICDGSVFSDGWPSNFSRIRRFINAAEGDTRDGIEAFRAVLSAFGFIYTFDKEAGLIIRYTSRPED